MPKKSARRYLKKGLCRDCQVEEEVFRRDAIGKKIRSHEHGWCARCHEKLFQPSAQPKVIPMHIVDYQEQQK